MYVLPCFLFLFSIYLLVFLKQMFTFSNQIDWYLVKRVVWKCHIMVFVWNIAIHECVIENQINFILNRDWSKFNLFSIYSLIRKNTFKHSERKNQRFNDEIFLNRFQCRLINFCMNFFSDTRFVSRD